LFQTKLSPTPPQNFTSNPVTGIAAWLPPWRTDDTFGKGEEDADDVNFAVGTDPFGIFSCARKSQPSLEDPIEQIVGFDANQGYMILKQHHLRSALQFKASAKPPPKAKPKPKRNGNPDSDDEEEEEEEELNDFPSDLARALCGIRNTGGDDTLFVGPWVDERDVSGVLVTTKAFDPLGGSGEPSCT
jgi:hypothetical protein